MYLGFIWMTKFSVLEYSDYWSLMHIFSHSIFTCMFFICVLNMNAVCFCILWKHSWAYASAQQFLVVYSGALVIFCWRCNHICYTSTSYILNLTLHLFSNVEQGCICVV